VIIAATIWNLIRRGVAKSNAEIPTRENAWFGNDWPAGPNP
jgi:hypothetical protein